MVDAGMSYYRNPEVEFEGSVWGVAASADSRSEEIYLPFLHLVSPKIDNWRWGVSVVAPAGISKRWDSPMQSATAEKSYLGVLEVNPSVAYSINSQLSLGAGIRFAYGEAEMKAQLPAGIDPVLIQGYRQDLEGDAWEVGYNLAVTFKPKESLNVAAIYRSEIDLDIEGDGSGFTTNPLTGGIYPFEGVKGGASLPVPAMLGFGVSQTIGRATLEVVYERTFWSSFKELDLAFADPMVEATLGAVVSREWNDTDSIRLGIRYRVNDALQWMGGVSFEQTPIPSKTFSFDLPDSDVWWFGTGVSYTIRENMELVMAGSYGNYESRNITDAVGNINGIVGEFSHLSFYSVAFSFSYRFSP